MLCAAVFQNYSTIMNGLKVLLLFFALILVEQGFSQSNALKIIFKPTYGSEVFLLKDAAFVAENGWRIEELKCYVSNFRLLKKGKVVFQEKNSFHLIDASDESSFAFILSSPETSDFDALAFDLGIDSTTNAGGAQGGDLDPTKGMYWTWQSGYINFKLEGTSALCPTRNHEFQFHLGGYQFPNSTLQKLHFSVEATAEIQVVLDLKQFLEKLDLASQNQVMSPGADAVNLSKLVAAAIRLEL